MLNKEEANSVDEYIRDRIIRLNEQGIKTFFSCSGIYSDHPHISNRDTLHWEAYLVLDLHSIKKYIDTIAVKLRTDVRYSTEEWHSNLGRDIERYEKLMEICDGRKLYVRDMWYTRIDCLTNNGNYSRPVLSFYQETSVHEATPSNLKDEHTKLRWDRLFDMLLSLKKEQ